MGASSDCDSLLLVSDVSRALSALSLKGLCDLRFCLSGYINETTSG